MSRSFKITQSLVFVLFQLLSLIGVSQTTEQNIESLISEGRLQPGQTQRSSNTATQARCPSGNCASLGGQQQNLLAICEASLQTEVCQSIPKESRRTCTIFDMTSSEQNIWDILVGCGSGLGVSLWSYVKLAGDLVMGAWKSMTSDETDGPSIVTRATSYVNVLRLYLATEYQKALNSSSAPLKQLKAIKKIMGKVGVAIYSAIESAFKERSAGFSCMNTKARSKLICETAADIFIPPAAAYALLTQGWKAAVKFVNLDRVRKRLDAVVLAARKATPNARVPETVRAKFAERVIDRKLNPAERIEVQRSHMVGIGEIGKDGTPARLGNFTDAQLRKKAEILVEAGFTKKERRALVENGVVGASESELKHLIADRRVRRRLDRLCHNCPIIQVRTEGLEHARQRHFFPHNSRSSRLFEAAINLDVKTINSSPELRTLAHQFADKKGSGRSLFPSGIEVDDVLNLIERRKFRDFRVAEVRQHGVVKLSGYVDLGGHKPGRYRITMFVCDKPRCPGPPGRPDTLRGDLISVFPSCGPGVIQISRYAKDNAQLGISGIKKIPCP